MNDYKGFWIKIISFLVSKMMLVRALFSQIFYEKRWKFFKIIFSHCLQLSKLACFCCYKTSDIFYILFLVEVISSEGIDVLDMVYTWR